MVNLSMAMCVSHNQMVKDESHLTAMDLVEVPKPFTTSRGMLRNLVLVMLAFEKYMGIS